jgi:hypothetical protein
LRRTTAAYLQLTFEMLAVTVECLPLFLTQFQHTFLEEKRCNYIHLRNYKREYKTYIKLTLFRNCEIDVKQTNLIPIRNVTVSGYFHHIFLSLI